MAEVLMRLPAAHPESVLLITVDSCRYDTFSRSDLPVLKGIGPLHKALAPSYFTYGSHAAFWMGFTPGVIGSQRPWLNPKAGKLFRMAHAGSGGHGEDAFRLHGANVIEGFRSLGYRTIGTGAVAWFDAATPTGAVLSNAFDHFWYSGQTWNLPQQLQWLQLQLDMAGDQPVFVFLNVGETHVPYWHQGADWDPWPSPCIPFGGRQCSRRTSQRRQRACLEWVDHQLAELVQAYSGSTILACADHGDCWGEDGLWEHGVSHAATLTVPLLMRVRGQPI